MRIVGAGEGKGQKNWVLFTPDLPILWAFPSTLSGGHKTRPYGVCLINIRYTALLFSSVFGMRTTYSMYSAVSLLAELAAMPALRMVSTA